MAAQEEEEVMEEVVEEKEERDWGMDKWYDRVTENGRDIKKVI